MPKRFCECSNHVVIIRRVTKSGRRFGQTKIFSDRHHALCMRCARELFQSLFQQQKFVGFLSVGQTARVEQIYAEY